MPRGKAGAARKPVGSEERSYRKTIADLLAFVLPFALIAGLAIGGGGYDLFARHIAGILAWALVAILLIGRWPDQIRPGRALALAGGLILGLALFSAVSSIWSSSVSVSLAESERVFGYLGIFLAGYLTLRTSKQRRWFACGIAAGIAVIVLLALGDRLIPGGQPSQAEFSLDRLSFPLGYWNGNGVVFGLGMAFFIWLASGASGTWWRVGTVAMATLAATALYLTYSRGGTLVIAISLLLLLFLSSHRLRILVTAGISVAAAVPILFTIDKYPTISGVDGGDPATGESLVVLLVALVCLTLGALAVEALVRVNRRRPELTRRPLELSRDRRVLLPVAGTLMAGLLILILAFGNSAWNQFSDSDVPAQTDLKDRFTELSGAWRYEFSGVALDTFSEHPLTGSGAGTYRFEWTQMREVPVVTTNAHSFYLENLAELGFAGGLLALGLALAIICLAILAWRRRLGRDAPIFLAASVAFFVSLAFDWFWQLGTTAALLMLFAAWIASSEAVDRDRKPMRTGAGTKFAGLILAWVAIVILGVPAIADRYLQAAADSVRSGNVETAFDQARMASRLEPWAPEPHMQLGTIAESRGQTDLALAEYNRAIELEPGNWRAVQLRLGANYESGRVAAARRDFALLGEMNPVYFGSLDPRDIRQLLP